MNFPVFDLHCDTALALLGRELNEAGSLRSNSYMIDLNRAGKLPGYAQCFACFTTPEMSKWHKKSPVKVFELELATILREVEKNKDVISLAYSAEDIENNYQNGIMSALLTIEGPAGFDFDPALLEDLYKIGFRITTLGWNEKNPLCGSHITGEGLSDTGKEYVKEAQRLGMLVDVSHISDRAFWDIMEITTAPIIATHSNSRTIWDVSRNLSDDMFRAICQTGGVAGFNMYADFVGNTPDLDTAADHFLHFMQIDPAGQHICLGGDLDGCDTLVDGFNGVQDYPKLSHKLRQRGLDDCLIKNIFWDNAIGVMKSAVRNNKI